MQRSLRCERFHLLGGSIAAWSILFAAGCCLQPSGEQLIDAGDAGPGNDSGSSGDAGFPDSGLDAGPDSGPDGGLDGGPDAGPPTSCTIAGAEFSQDEGNPTNPCESCQPLRSARGWSSLNNGQPCASGTAVCIGGTCTAGCFIDSAYVVEDALDPSNGCETCQSSSSLSGWTTLPDGASCPGGLCLGGLCQLSCSIAGLRYPDRSENPGDPSQCCNATLAPGAWTFSLQPGADTQVGKGPSALATGDFDGDGQEDLAVADQIDDNVSILLNNQGTLVASGLQTAGTSPVAIVAQDFDGDGKLDLAVLNFGNGSIVPFPGLGTGIFSTGSAFTAGTAPVAMVSGDFDGDGLPDLVSLDPPTDAISFFANSGAFVFAAASISAAGLSDGGPPQPIPYPDYEPPPAMVSGDLRGNGVLDLAIVDGVQLSVLLGDGTGKFPSVTHYATGSQPVDVAIGDLDGDGILDLVVANYGSDGNMRPGDNTIGVFLGKGDGTFADQVTYPANYVPAWVTLVDLDGDGRAEVVLTRYDEDSINVLWHLPGGALSRPTELFIGTRFPGRTVPIHLQRPGAFDLVGAKQTLSSFGVIGEAVTTTLNGCP